jgi:hypothetical protein
MNPKTTIEPQISPVPPGEGFAVELEGDPPFERWIRLADTLLGKTVPPLPKIAKPRDPKTPPVKH